MKTVYIIGNWKSNKTTSEAKEWFEAISHYDFSKVSQAKVILCPPFHLLQLSSALIQEYQLPFSLGAQDTSLYPIGAHTGEIAAEQLKEFVRYVLLGHSERRKDGETDEMVAQKTTRVREAGLTPIICVQGKETPIPHGVEMIAYEPVFAIGSGHPDTPEDAQSVLQSFRQNGIQTTIYGGSVTPENASGFLAQPAIDGVLPGTASLDPKLFAEIILQAYA